LTIQITRWTPDTCGCIIEYQWDDTVDPALRTHTIKNVVNKCVVHTAQGPDTNHFNVVLDENQKKNQAIDHIVQNAPAAFVDILPDGTKQLKAGITIDFTHTGVAPNRLITLTIKGITLTTAQTTNLQSRLDTRFGVGKVTVVNVP
jgi:hypothetical protein